MDLPRYTVAIMIEREWNDGILTLRLAHGKVSAMDLELVEALMHELEDTASARAVVLTGTGSSFSAGVDLFRVVNEGADYVRRFFPLLADMIRSLFMLPVPVVTAANGHAIAGGAILLLASDYRLIARGKGRVGVPELLVGVPFPASALEVVQFAVPPQHVQSIIYTGRTLLPEEALAHGLVDEVAEPEALLDRAHEVARQLAALPPDAFRLTKQQLRAPACDRADRLGVAFDPAALTAWCAPETHERIREYLAKTVKKS